MELKELVRKARGEMPVDVFAERLGVTRQAVYMWESGAARPARGKLTKMGIVQRYELAGKR